MCLCREANERSATRKGANARVGNRRAERSLSAVRIVVLSSDQRALSINLDHLFGKSDLVDHALLKQEHAVAKAAQ